VVGGERFGRYSFIGRPRALPRQRLWRCRAHRGRDRRPGGGDPCGNPLDFIAAYQKRFKVALRPGLPRFCGGLAGYFGYDAVRYIEKKLETPARPTAWAARHPAAAVRGGGRHRQPLGQALPHRLCRPGQPEAYAAPRSACASSRTSSILGQRAQVRASGKPPGERSFAKADYLAAVERPRS
jgi:anthranilate synthase component 1